MISGNVCEYVYEFDDIVDRTEVEIKGVGDVLMLCGV